MRILAVKAHIMSRDDSLIYAYTYTYTYTHTRMHIYMHSHTSIYIGIQEAHFGSEDPMMFLDNFLTYMCVHVYIYIYI